MQQELTQQEASIKVKHEKKVKKKIILILTQH